jgi:hypothetical protein
MAWQTELPTIVRYIINDLDSTRYKYSDERIETTVTIAAQMVILDISLQTQYDINIQNISISPDPTESVPKDNVFINLTALKTACIILGSEVKTEGGNAISIKDGPSAIDLRGVASTISFLYEDICGKYEKLLKDYKEDLVASAGQAILGPYSPGADFISRTHNDYDHRGNYFRY